ncbi:MAG: glutathione S-transferase family protein [Pseudomonadales bacterium]
MDIFLHHYPASLFSEKVRLLLGYLGAEWHSVVIPSIMPRPLLMPLSGGYRKTPVLQIDANVYCDTRIIARALARQFGNEELYAHGFVAERVADWADTDLFRITVALNFAPAALGPMMGSFPPEEMAAFQKDRAELTAGASITSYSAEAARGYLAPALHELNAAVTQGFLFGPRPCVADFAVYHCLWFLRNNPVNAPLVDDFSEVLGWMERMADFGHGQVRESNGEAALAAARGARPVLPAIDSRLPEGFSVGRAVEVTPVDYGRVPVRGKLAAWSVDEIVIERETDDTGPVMVHFPSPGFEVRGV